MPNCYGTGYKTVRKFKVSIPAGIDNGQCIRMAGGGEPGTNGGERGDLLVEAVVSQHPIFKRQDTSIYSTVPISFAKAALGGPIRIKTVDGEVEYEVKPGTQTDTKVRLKGKGVPSLRNRNVRGDHYVTLVVKVPERMNQAQKDALKRYDDLMNGIEPEGEKPRKGLLNGEQEVNMLIKKRKNTVPPWKIFILTVVGFGLMLAIAVHSRNEALNRLNQEYTITDDAKPRHIKFESMPVGEAEQAVGMYLRYNAMVQFEESGKILSDDLAKNVPFDSMQADFENGIYPQDVLVHGFKTLSEEEYGDEKSQYDNHATLLGYTSYKVVRFP